MKKTEENLPESPGCFRSLGRTIRSWFVRPGRGRGHQRLKWTNDAIALLGLGVAGYVSGVCGVFFFDRHQRKIVGVRFVDVLLPSRWSNVRTARGDHFLDEARHLLAREKYAEGLMLAGKGLELSPANRDGRLLFAGLRQAMRGPQFARQTLIEGLRHHSHDAVFLKHLFTFLLRQNEDRHVVALARRLTADGRTDPGARRVIALAGATACYLRGSYDEAEDFLRDAPGLAPSREARLLGVRIEWQRGYAALALTQLRQLAVVFPDDFEIHQEHVYQLRECGLEDEARRASLTFQLAHPNLPEARIQLLEAYRRAGEATRVAGEVEALLHDFATHTRALVALAVFGANSGDPALVHRVAAHAALHRLPVDAYPFLSVEAAIVARDYRGALDLIHGFAELDQTAGQHHPLFDSLQAIAHAGLGNDSIARIFLSKFLHQPNLRAENLLAVANRFAAIDAGRSAWQVLLQAVAVDPKNQAALTRLVELDLSLNRVDELAGHLQRLIQMRRPSQDILRVAERKLGSDLFLFSGEAPAAIQAARLALAEPAGRRGH
ncbi:MAG: hypothetical protein EXS37_20980 [Opitutus sp.]|nr:hypothetical protein [Opitutus sp.]